MVTGPVVPLRVGGVEVLVEATVVAGSEPTSRADRAGERLADAFERAHDLIIEMAADTVRLVREATERAARPQRIEVEFGLKFSAQGNVIVAGASGEATLVVRLGYDTSRAADAGR
jgi:Trypsin-co-occurring domain 1